ncbi:hypothetical protein CEP53_012000 [Fusarium sp. AF-6]|nr:hypothetical protein CEP53_012000 [Fusarium sp. AF-6]
MPKNGSHLTFVVAGHLAETPNVKILIVEASDANSQDIHEATMPSSAMSLRGSKHDWASKTTIVRRDDYEL